MTRERLPNRRTSITFDLLYWQMLYSVTFAVYPKTMRAGEIFLTLDRKSGAAVEGIARDSLILASFALQHGADLEELRAAMTRDHAGAPASVAGAALDAVAGTLAEIFGDAPA